VGLGLDRVETIISCTQRRSQDISRQPRRGNRFRY